ncbi:bifunctional diaminohydroxyphosphoribosylaminopyrimidine deaminase/5-amino-6-(5-phosphoribosylamino)uracil reductase RibD [Hippea jasoniae]|uniref:bifunctional diaminohydroxyphosphoribosylaminopyrimidine deaminase/5-amino-6-(5-phosphoribosylamino)uracil reductase RibD n=1 Tax=Hippea jasoniae TaxID=944479 RepID=UPI000689E9F7|nr:bifunctional diaminohydroxyphosphoribosylaminopyrimidine deaminase/5-amino-6-(5-phosphoribosylamino)uracil reductase RibD [Hippea jasoniae]
MTDDEIFMSKALKLAKKAKGKTCPNPMVGAVIVKNSKIIAEGYHKKAGKPHAEVEAINSVKDKSLLKGATMYVTLEPCNHYGRTPPCSLAIIKSGIKRVVIAMKDPNKTASGGIERLKKAGIEVKVGVLEEKAKKLNEVFIENITNKKPFYIMKAAMLLNGLIALKGGNSKWITNPSSRRFAHRLRGTHSAILVGINTILMDDPLLTCRIKGYRQPKRVILDANLKTPVSANIFSVYPDNIIIITSPNAPEAKKRVLEATGATIVECKTKNGEFDKDHLNKLLLELEICSVVVEGGSRTHGYFLKHRLYNKAYLFFAPKLSGSYGAFNAVGSEAVKSPRDAVKLSNISCKYIDNDILIEGYF